MRKNIYSKGYRYIFMGKDFNLSNSEGYAPAHRIVMQDHLGRNLNKNDIVHHINGNKRDNRIENLILCSSHSEHMKLHKKNKNIKCKCGCGMCFDGVSGRNYSATFISGHYKIYVKNNQRKYVHPITRASISRQRWHQIQIRISKGMNFPGKIGRPKKSPLN